MEKKNLFSNPSTQIAVKIFIGFLMAIFLLIPIQMIENMILERSGHYDQVIQTIGHDWGGIQTISGPFLIVPFKETAANQVINYYYENGVQKKTVQTVDLVITPENLNISASTNPNFKHRGIYKFVVYNSNLDISGDFTNFDLSDIRTNNKKIVEGDLDWANARLQFNITDAKGISGDTKISWGKTAKKIKPINTSQNAGDEGFYCHVNVEVDSSAHNSFSANIKLKGSQSLSFIPMGNQTKTILKTQWSAPKFFGSYSPDTSYFEGKTYFSSWSLSQLARPMPNCWLSNNQPPIEKFNFGVELIEPVDKYQQTMRSAKYAILIILLSFLTIFFFEFFTQQNSNFLQYILIGLALVLFYSLLLSLTEQMSFGFAYLLSAFAIVGLVTVYFHSIFKKLKTSLIMFSFWAILYSFLYLILQLEDFALLAGNVFLFIILALVMFVSRKMKIPNLNGNKSNEISIDKGDLL